MANPSKPQRGKVAAADDDPAADALSQFFNSLASAGTNLAEWAKHQWPQHRRKLHVAQAFVVALNAGGEG